MQDTGYWIFQIRGSHILQKKKKRIQLKIVRRREGDFGRFRRKDQKLLGAEAKKLVVRVLAPLI